MKKKTFIILLVFILFALNHYTINAMSQLYDQPQPSFNLYPYKNDNIGVIHESLEYVITSAEPLQNQISHINEDYKLKNLSDKREEILVAFVMIGKVNPEEIDVSFNGEKKQITRTRLDRVRFIGNGFTLLDERNMEQILGVNFKFSDILGVINNQLNIVTKTDGVYLADRYGEVNLMFFKLSFEPNSINELHISHKVTSGFSKNKYGSDIKYMYEHLLDPASYWKNFGDLDVTIKLPNKYILQAFEEGSLLSQINKVEDEVYRKHFSTVPSGKITFSIGSNQHLKNPYGIMPFFTITSITIITIIIAVVIMGIFLLIFISRLE